MKGQTLVETVLALSLVAIILSGITVLVTSSLSNASFGQNQTLSTQYAQEGIEVLREIRNTNYATFKTYDSGASNMYCLGGGSSSLSALQASCSPNVPSSNSFFERSVTINQPGVNTGCSTGVAKVTVTVSWTDGKCSGGSFCHKSKLVSCLSTNNPIQAP